MLSDRWRGLKVAGLLLLIGGLGVFYTYRATHIPHGWHRCTSQPTECDGVTLTFPLWTVTAVECDERYAISKVARAVVVIGPSDGLEVGDTISLIGRFRATDSAIVEQRREVHGLRPWKTGLSLVAILLGVAALPFAFRWRNGRIEERSG